MRQIVDAAGWVTAAMRPPKRVAFYTGLGVLAVVEMIEWPVAVAVGAGTELARRMTGANGPERTAEEAGQPEGGEQDTEPWPGYDQHNVEEVNRRLADAEPKMARAVAAYERRHRHRTTVLTEADRQAD